MSSLHLSPVLKLTLIFHHKLVNHHGSGENSTYNLNQEKVKYSKSIESESEMIMKRKSAFKSFNTLVMNSPLFLVGQGDFWHLRRRHQHTLEILQFKQTLQRSTPSNPYSEAFKSS